MKTKDKTLFKFVNCIWGQSEISREGEREKEKKKIVRKRMMVERYKQKENSFLNCD